MPAAAAERLAAIEATGARDAISDAEAARRAGGRKPASTSDVDDTESGEKGVPLPVVTSNLPAIVGKHLAAAAAVEPEWHQVRHLPGYLWSSFRALGRAVFGAFTSTPIEEIQVLADLGGQGPNSSREIDAVARWLQQNGVQDTAAVMDFARSVPGYQAEMVAYGAHGYTFLLVRDFAGRYVYAWPAGDERAVSSAKRPSVTDRS